MRKVLEIVTHSLYTNREIFVRELVSNAADALEKIRHEQVVSKDVFDADLALDIEIALNEKEHTFAITDTGIGMTHEELIENLGTIAHSGSGEFLEQLAEAARKDVNLIGQFGVGFYSVFMVANRVRVLTRSYHKDAQGYEWISDGASYTVAPCEGLHRGTRIIAEMKDDCHEFEKEDEIKRIIKQYSSFVPFPIKLKGKEVNTVQAIWTRNKNDITEREYNEFYRYISGDIADPTFRLHFSADAPLQIYAVLFTPKSNIEHFGFGRFEPGVDLYCRKVLIEKRPPELLPEWLRFVRGVVDSEDLPLNISRETMQDSALMRKLSNVLTSRLLKMFAQEAEKDADAYSQFYLEFSGFFKEGIIRGEGHQDQIAPLLRYESSKSEAGKTVSLTEYIGRMKDGQKAIYYINGPTREVIEAGPYLETFRTRDIEVIYTFDPVDDFVFSHLREFEEKKFLSADAGDLQLPGGETKEPEGAPLESKAMADLCGWMKRTLGERVKEVRKSDRLVDSPAISVQSDAMMTGAMQRLLQAVHKDYVHASSHATLELNPRHALIKKLSELKKSDEELAKQISEQLFDNALIAAGLMTDPRLMIQRVNKLLERAAGV
ncbi:MAG: molecular chaperone HtpG [Candidatus Sumerlaeota bacterium]|nr:molecular chaperone HtpG [Candidatus Sumerlaeota bacterium]